MTAPSNTPDKPMTHIEKCPEGHEAKEGIAANFTRTEYAKRYASLIQTIPLDDVATWREINKRIIERWSVSGLEYIKKVAWETVEPSRRSAIPKEGD